MSRNCSCLAMQRLAGRGCRCGVDIAAGHGRYVLDALAKGIRRESILLRDYSDLNVVAGTALIEHRGLAGTPASSRATPSIATARGDRAAADPRRRLGALRTFPDNAPGRRSLAGLAAAVPPGGYLIYTNQPWHPQLELIARALTSHRARPGLDHAPPHASRNGPARRRRRLSKNWISASTSGASSPSPSPSGSEARLEPSGGEYR